MSTIQIGKYKHYKDENKLYNVIGVARHSENPEEEFVVYQALYKGDFPEGQIWIRPYKMFLEKIIVDGKTVPRFTYVGD